MFRRLKRYTVHQPPAAGDTSEHDRALATCFVREGFSWPAFVLGPIWLGWQRLWVPLGVYLLAMIVAVLLLNALGHGEGARLWVYLVGALLLGFEAGNLQRARLRQTGFEEKATVVGHSLAECELRYFAGAGSRPAAAGEPA